MGPRRSISKNGRKVKSCSSVFAGDSASAQTHLSAKEAHGRLWRNLMELQLPMDEEMWETDRVGSLTLTQKPGVLNAHSLLVYAATVSAAKSEPVNKDTVKQLQPRPGGGPNMKQSKKRVSQSQPNLPGVVVANEGANKDKVFDVNPNITRAGTINVMKLTNRDLQLHHSLWQRLKRFVCCKDVAHPLEFDFLENPPRTFNSTAFITGTLDHLSSKRVPQGRAEARNNLLEAYRLTIDALRYLAKITDMCENATETLSYSKYYLERRLTEEELKLTAKKSIVGSLAWISTYCIKFLITGQDIEDSIRSDVKLRIEDVVGGSILLWSAMVHLVETTRSVVHILEHAVIKFIMTLKAPEEERRDSSAPHAEIDPDKVDRLKRRRWRIKHAAALKLAMEDRYYWQGKRPPRPVLTVFTKTKETDGMWVDLQGCKTKETISVIIRSSSKLLAIIEDELTQLTNLDKAVQGIIGPLDSIKKTKNLLECTLVLEKVLHSLHEFPNNLLKQTEVDDLKEVGRIVLDKLDAFYMTLEDMQGIAFEALNIVHVCYEYTRTFYRWPMAEYDTFGPDNHKKYMDLWAHNPEFKVAKPPEALKEPIPFFNDSIYQKILKTVVLNVADRDICVAPSGAKEPTSVMEALAASKLAPPPPEPKTVPLSSYVPPPINFSVESVVSQASKT